MLQMEGAGVSIARKNTYLCARMHIYTHTNKIDIRY